MLWSQNVNDRKPRNNYFCKDWTSIGLHCIYTAISNDDLKLKIKIDKLKKAQVTPLYKKNDPLLKT